MLFQRISRRGPERIFGVFQNVDSAAMSDGEVVVLNTTATPVLPGVEIKKSTALSQVTVVGVVSGNIAIGDFGLVQVYGIHTNVKTTQAALAVGNNVFTNAAAAAEVNAAAITHADLGTLLGVCVVVGASNRATIFIRTLGG